MIFFMSQVSLTLNMLQYFQLFKSTITKCFGYEITRVFLYLQAWCESNTKQSLMQEVLNDPHSPHKVRVIGTLSNSPEFASTFKCPKNSPMNPEDKCIIW